MAVIGIGGAVLGSGLVPMNSNADDPSSPTPSSAPSATPTGAAAGARQATSAAYLTSRSEPTRMVIPALHVRTKVVTLGTALNKTMQLPPQRGAGWFDGSVSPGEPGTSIIAGFIKGSSQKDGVFVHLAKLGRGDVVRFQRTDGHTAVYKVTKITTYPEGTFPAEKVYSSTATPILRMVTTGGTMKPSDPVGNVVVDARLVSVH